MNQQAPVASETKNLICSSCDIQCTVQGKVVDGQVVKIQSSDNPAFRDHLCMKGIHAPKGFAHPDRVLYPMKRVGERGSGRFERVTWDEAIADIAAYFSQAMTVSSGTPVGSEERATVCASCHMADGVSADPNNPILAGQYESYLAHTLRGYRDGTRANAIMAGMAAGLSDDDIDALAEYYSQQVGLGDRAPE